MYGTFETSERAVRITPIRHANSFNGVRRTGSHKKLLADLRSEFWYSESQKSS